MRPVALLIAVAASLAACGEEQSNNLQSAAPPAEVEVLPPAESDFNANVPAPNPTQVANNAAAVVAADGTMPAALRGRWGLGPGDCTSTRGDAKGLITVNEDSVRFYESVAKPVNVRSRSANQIRGRFAFAGEGQTWEKPMVWSARGDKLIRIDSEPDSRLVYTRCP